MAYTITSKSYGPRKPYITATATSTDDLAALGTDFAEGSTCIISTTTYKLDKVKGWIDPSQGGGSGGGGVLVVNVTIGEEDDGVIPHTCDKTAEEMLAAFLTGIVLLKTETAIGAFFDAVTNAYATENNGAEFYVSDSDNFSGLLCYSADTFADYPVYFEDSGGGGGGPS